MSSATLAAMRGAAIAVLWAIAASASALAGGAELPRCDERATAYDMGRRESYESYSAHARRRHCRKPWTVLVYMAADNDLAPYAHWDLYEMEAGYRSGRVAAGSTGRADLLVQLNAPGKAQGRRLHIFQDTRPYDSRLTLQDFRRGTAPKLRSPVTGFVPLVSGDGQPLAADRDFARFVEWGIREYPADHVMVVVWGHGQGWAPSRSPLPDPLLPARPFGGIAFSDSHGTFLDIPGLRAGLRAAEEKLLNGRPIDVYASDACLMQMVEVASELSDSARYIVGSSQVQNYLGLPYRRMMLEINEDRFSGERLRPGVAGSALENDEPYLLARMLPRIFRMSLQEHGLHGTQLPDAIRTVTMSSVSGDELRLRLMPALERFARAMNLYLDEDPTRGIGVQQAIELSPSFMGGTQELGSFLTLLKQELRDEPAPAARALWIATDEAAQALNRSVVAYSLGTRYEGNEGDLHLLGFRALAIWLPVSTDDYLRRAGDFASSRFYREMNGAWQEWLRRLYP